MKFIKYLLCVIALFTNFYAQEIGVAPVKLWTDNSEIQNPFGFSVHLAQPIWKLSLKVEYISVNNKTNFHGLVGSGFLLQDDSYFPEPVKSKSSYEAIEFSIVVPEIINYNVFSLGLGTGLSHNKFDGEREGLDSGRKSNLFKESKFGIFYVVSISATDFFELPLKIELLFKQKNLFGGVYATDVVQPFEGAMDIKELQLAFSYIL